MSEMSDLHDEAEEVEGEADEWIEPDSDEYVNLAEGNIESGEIDDAMYNYQQAASKAEDSGYFTHLANSVCKHLEDKDWAKTLYPVSYTHLTLPTILLV